MRFPSIISLGLLLLICCAVDLNGLPATTNIDSVKQGRLQKRYVATTLADSDSNLDTNVSGEKDILKAELQSIFQPAEQQAQQLNTAIDNTFKNIHEYIERELKKRPGPDPNATSCGYQMECVEIWLCRKSTLNNNDTFSRQILSSYKEDKCNYNQVCCHIGDKLLTKPSSVKPLKMRDCGYLNENGVKLSIEGAEHNEVSFGEFPWMVALLVKEKSLLTCIGSGSLIAPNVVLTAAHKVSSRSEDSLIARAGEWDQETQQDIAVLLIITHNHFKNNINNIALLFLRDSFSPSLHISPICLPSESDIFDYSQCIVTGWGNAESECISRSGLKKTSVSVIPQAVCNDRLRQIVNPFFSIDQSYICACGEIANDSCHFEGGSPLICPIQGSPNRYHQAGIVAWNFGCYLKNLPTAYTNVAHLMPWVRRELGKLDIGSRFYSP